MDASKITTREKFLDFCKKEFPGKAVKWTEWYCFVQAGTIWGDDVHYEFNKGTVSLHIEGRNWRGIRNYLRWIKPSMMKPSHWWRQDCCWTYDRKIENEDDLYSALKEIRQIIEPHILDFEKREGATPVEQRKATSIDAEIIPVSFLFKDGSDDLERIDKLRIPHYQRPYRWTARNVRQLLEDVSHAMQANKEVYRIGSVILHNAEDALDIVDGQQRLTTISLILKACNDTFIAPSGLKFGHTDSIKHIKENFVFIKNWLNEHFPNDIGAFADYILNHCEIVKIVVEDQSEAFQMFDSQNGRGKELLAYHLLKAYHIGAMDLNTQSEKIDCDVNWEKATQVKPSTSESSDLSVDVLKQLFDEQLYRVRRWTLHHSAGRFSKKKIGEFKGFTIDKNHLTQFPYQNPQLLQFLTAKFYASTLSGTVSTANRFSRGDSENIDPFASINQPIVNGISFFSYVQTYVKIYTEMFINLGGSALAEFKRFYYRYCLQYDCPATDVDQRKKDKLAYLPKGQAARSGDTYLRELYKSLTIAVLDRFGEKGLMKVYQTLYRLVYINRLKYQQVRYATVDDLPHQYFSIIEQAKDIADLSMLDSLLVQELGNPIKNEFTNIDEQVINFIKNGK